MIGPGTGVAPFRGFLQHRHCTILMQRSSLVGQWRGMDLDLSVDDDSVCPNDTWLFFGCRHSQHDFLYKEDLTSLTSFSPSSPQATKSMAGDESPCVSVIGRMCTAFSREETSADGSKVYVQTRIREHGKEVADLIVRKGALVFVCGDGANMARDVHTALQEVLCTYGGMTDAEAKAYLTKMSSERRYVRDIWS